MTFVEQIDRTQESEKKAISLWAFESKDWPNFKDAYESIYLTKIQADMEDQDFLYISVHEGKDLPPRDTYMTSDPSSDPYCLVQAWDSMKLIQQFRTLTRKKELNPIWGTQMFIFNKDIQRVSTIHVICNDEDKTKDDLEGTVSFDLTQIPNRTLVDRYFPLVCPDKAEAEIRISIYLSKGGHEGVFGESTSLATMWKAKQSQSRGNLEVNHAHGLYEISAGMLKVSNHYDPPHGEWPARVMFTIHKGKNLLPMDGSGLSDPYVVVFQGREKRKDTTYKTSVKKQTLNPIWFVNNRFSFTIPNDLSPQDAIINFQVYDADVASDDKMGACILELKDCLVNWTRWLPISYVPTECEVMNGTSEGKRLRREGYVPNYPIFCIPGFASSALSCEESTESLWRGERVWLNLTGLVKGKCTGIASKFSEHMSLQEDCVSDPPGIKVRPNLEIEGCKYRPSLPYPPWSV